MTPRSARDMLAMAVAVAAGLAVPAGSARAFEGATGCAHPQGQAARLVCSDPGLRALDLELAGLVERADAETRGVDGDTGRRLAPVEDEHRQWLRGERDACPDAACLAVRYRERIDRVRDRWSEALD